MATKASWILNSVVNSLLEEPTPDAGRAGGFIAASKWLGRRSGYLFTKGDKGLG
jgi:hypothetical protein